MRLLRLTAKNYRSLRDVSVDLGDLNLFIGANGSGKSAILDALRFLQEGIQTYDFRSPVFSRGGILNLAWKGEEAHRIELSVRLDVGEGMYEWSVRIIRSGYDFHVEEDLEFLPAQSPRSPLLRANRGEGWWWSESRKEEVRLKGTSTACALAAASADASFPARDIVEFISRWGFFDPNPFLLRRDWQGLDSGRFDPYGRNLAETLYSMKVSSPQTLDSVCSATRSVLGLPSEIEPRESEDRFYFVQNEPGLQYPVNQMGVSSGTLRMIALMTALHGQPGTNLIGIEEPENYIHPTALSSFVEHLQKALGRVQFLITTHSPMLLNFIGDPESVRIVRRSNHGGTLIVKEGNPDGVRKALDASGFGLGEFYETKGFGS